MDKNSECLEDRDKLKMPDNRKIPFLSYGFFKPGQLAFSQIKDFTNPDKVIPVDIKAKLKHVNGMPVLTKEYEDGDETVKGFIIKFKKKDMKDAYKIISYSKDMHIYSWDTIKIDGNLVNVLVSANPEVLENVWNDPKMPKALRDWYDYDWEKDPVYQNVLTFLNLRIPGLKRKIYSKQEHETNTHEVSQLFVQVQSLYMVLWSALDRFLTFRYGKSQKQNVIALSEEEFFEKSLLNRVKNTYTVTSAQNLKRITLDKEEPLCSAFYYYTLRNNVIHSGKMIVTEVKMIFDALEELKLIFEDIIDAVKKEKEAVKREFCIK